MRSTIAVLLVFLSAMSLSRAYAMDLPTDDEQDVLVRTTLMTFNDANVTGNYSVLQASRAALKLSSDQGLTAQFQGRC